MARQGSFEKKPEPAPPAIRWFLPMELQIGDRLANETGTWEVIAPPYSTAGGRIVHRWHLPHVSPDARGQAPGGRPGPTYHPRTQEQMAHDARADDDNATVIDWSTGRYDDVTRTVR